MLAKFRLRVQINILEITDKVIVPSFGHTLVFYRYMKFHVQAQILVKNWLLLDLLLLLLLFFSWNSAAS